MVGSMARVKTIKAPRVTTTIRLPPELRERLQSEAEDRDLSANYLVVKAIDRYLDWLTSDAEVARRPFDPLSDL